MADGTNDDDSEKAIEATDPGCRICDCPGYQQRPGGGIVCARDECKHYKGDHGPV
jgi:hypothetical protein